MTSANNQELEDDPLNQKLSAEQILQLKEEGLNGKLTHKEIIEKLGLSL